MITDEILAACAARLTITFAGATKRDDWECDAWTVTVAGPAPWITQYYTGVGHRKAKKPLPRGVSPRSIYGQRLLAGTDSGDWAGWYKARPVTPDPLDVLHALTLDGQAASMSFADWCRDFGYDPDSIKAFDTYRQCCAIGEQLRKSFTH